MFLFAIDDSVSRRPLWLVALLYLTRFFTIDDSVSRRRRRPLWPVALLHLTQSALVTSALLFFAIDDSVSILYNANRIFLSV
jgi:hypothetical protein